MSVVFPRARRIRTHYRTHSTEWFDYLLVSPVEMDEGLTETAWMRSETYAGEGGQYVAVLEKER